MVLGHGVVPLPGSPQQSSSGSLRDPIQLETPVLRVSLSRPESSGSGCSGDRLEQVVLDLPVPPDQPSPTGPQQTSLIQGQGNSSGPELAQCQVVPSTVRTSTGPASPSASLPVSDSGGQGLLGLLLLDPPPSRMVFLKEALGGSLSLENIDLLLSDKRSSTTHQYQCVWKKWTAYVAQCKPASISVDFCLSFFRHLFEGGTKPSTLASYKSALRDPLWWAFKVDLNDDYFARMLKGCVRLRPVSPPKPISWSLHKVLTHLASIDIETTTPKLRLAKTLFLLALASGSRLSELVALSRDEGQVLFYDSRLVKLSPDPTFLAKNELPSSRKKPLRIPALGEEYKSLCPVACLKVYIHSTSNVGSGSLFRTHSGGGPLTPAGMRRELVGIIKASNPGSFPRTHDIRKVASSLAFFEDMSFSDLAEYTGWSSPKVFYRHYLKRIGRVPWVCVSAGKVTVPPDTDSDTEDF